MQFGFLDAVGVVALAFLLIKGVAYLRILRAARRMSLRDKGYVVSDDENMVPIHPMCRTRVRIGIPKSNIALKYCWRCECIIGGGSGPKGREDIPEPQDPNKVSATSSDNVINLADRKSA